MRIAVISDIHEDLYHLQQAIRKIKRLKCDKIVCLGDISGFSVPHYTYLQTRNASECLKLVKESCDIIVIGNHDLYAAKMIPHDSHYFSYPDNWYDLDYRQKLMASKGKVWLYMKDELDPCYTYDDIAFIRSLPLKASLKIDKHTLFFSHYIFPNISGDAAVFLDQQENGLAMHLSYMQENEYQIAFSGHTHFPGLYIVMKERIIQKSFKMEMIKKNPSLVFVPAIARGRNRSGFIIFDTETMKIQAKPI